MTHFHDTLNGLPLPQTYESHGKEYYVDSFREKLILKTPEETIRQKIIQHLLLSQYV